MEFKDHLTDLTLQKKKKKTIGLVPQGAVPTLRYLYR